MSEEQKSLSGFSSEKRSFSILETNFFVPLLFVFCTAVAFAMIYGKGIWADEGFSIFISGLKPQDIMTVLSMDAHPPLYYFFLHWLLKFGKSELFLKFPSFVCVVLTEVLVYYTALKLYNRKVAIVSLLFASVSFTFLFWNLTVRMFCFLTFFSMLSYYSYVCILSDSGNRFLWKLFYVISSLLAVYSQYLAVFVLLSQLIHVLLLRDRAKILQIFYLQLIVFLFFAPFLPFIKKQMSAGAGPQGVFFLTFYNLAESFARQLSFAFAGGGFLWPQGDAAFAAWIFFAAMFFIPLIYQISRPDCRFFSINILIIIIFLITSVFLTVKPMFEYRYFAFLMPFWAIMFASTLFDFFKKYKIAAIFLVSLYLIFNAVSLFNSISNPFYGYQRWKEVMSVSLADFKDGDCVVIMDNFQSYTFLYYLPDKYKRDVYRFLNEKQIKNILSQDIVLNTDSIPYKRVWLFATMGFRNEDPDFALLKSLDTNMHFVKGSTYSSFFDVWTIRVMLFEGKNSKSKD